MKITSCVLENFGSYERLEFDFSSQGLTLIEGPTGSGKSTLCDALPWVLFGKTAKGGAVDEIRSWTSDAPTRGTANIQAELYSATIVRTRGAAKDNDLYCILYGDIPVRGKDLADTQRLINGLLGVDYDTYLAAAYYHEFSQTAQFFSTTAKNRRAICEQLVDLTLAKTLQMKVAETKKELSCEQEKLTTNIAATAVEIRTYIKLIEDTQAKAKTWDRSHAAEITRVKAAAQDFDRAKQSTIQSLKLEAAEFTKQRNAQIRELNEEIATSRANILDDAYFDLARTKLYSEQIAIGDPAPCPECGAPQTEEHAVLERKINKLHAERDLSDKCRINVQRLERQIKALNSQENLHFKHIASETTRENTYAAQLETLRSAANPHLSALQAYKSARESLESGLQTNKKELIKLDIQISDLETLVDVLAAYRSTSVKHTIEAVQDRTNDLLSTYFDAEIRVTFSADDNKLDVEITKDGNQASFTQLSKGQRQLLKLTFGISVMKTIAERQAVKFDQIFLDELTDGLDETFKVKAFRLLEALTLEYDSIFVVEHNEALKSMFTNRYSVELVNGKSQIAKTE